MGTGRPINFTQGGKGGLRAEVSENETPPSLGAGRFIRFLSVARFFVSVGGMTLSLWASTCLVLVISFVTWRQSVALPTSSSQNNIICSGFRSTASGPTGVDAFSGHKPTTQRSTSQKKSTEGSAATSSGSIYILV